MAGSARAGKTSRAAKGSKAGAKRGSLLVVLGDHLNLDSALLRGGDASQDVVWMAEVAEESTHVWSHRARSVLFLSAMRHFRDALQGDGWEVAYRQLDDPQNLGSLGAELGRSIAALRPARVVAIEPGDYRVRQQLEEAADAAGAAITWLPDEHFYCRSEEFAAYRAGRKQLRLEYFYRELRRKHAILMDGDEPTGGQWNYDHDNRGAFGKGGPPVHEPPRSFVPDAITREVMALVAERFRDHPGGLEAFDWPVTRDDALAALADFVEHRLPEFGIYQDAMWTHEPYLFHSRISAALNLKLLDPREVIAAAVEAYQNGHAPLAAVEGFVRQILGWREYVRGIYWTSMPAYEQENFFAAEAPLPPFYWTGETDMHCLRESIGQTLEYGYAHHIQRLMVTGLFALLLGVEPRQVHAWYLAVYIDAVEWVEMPNVLGMSQFADGGLMASKPYAATGKYIQRMSNYCASCRYKPQLRVGEEACPFTTLYWDFLARNRERLQSNSRMGLQLRNLDRIAEAELEAIRSRAEALRVRWDAESTDVSSKTGGT